MDLENEGNQYDGFDPNNQLRPTVNRMDFYSTTNFELGWLLVRPIRIAESPEEEPELAKRFSQGQKALYFWWLLDSEVTKGGFVQFYYNKMERYIPAVLKGLDFVGATEMAALIRKAQEAFKESKTKIETARNKTLFNKDLYQQLKALTSLDAEYNTLVKQTMAEMEAFIRQHPNDFCVDEKGQPFGTGTEKPTTYHDNGKVFEEYTVVNNCLHGTYKSYDETGTPKQIYNYVKGKQTGAQQLLFANGKPQEIKTIDAETRHQKIETFYPTGNPLKLQHFDANGQKKGVFKEWFEDGSLKESATFISQEEREGEWVKFWPSGYKKIDAICSKGNIKFINYWTADGEQLMKDGTGLFINEFEMDMAIMKTRYRYETTYKDYKRNGQMKQYVNGELVSTQEFKEGVEVE